MVSLHESLGEIFAALQYGTGFRWPDDGNPLGARIVLERVVNAIHQWVFRAYYHHVNLPFNGKVFQFVELVDADSNVLATVFCACIAWCDVQFLTFLALSNLPCEGVFSAAASKK